MLNHARLSSLSALSLATLLAALLASPRAEAQQRFDVQQFNPTVSAFTGFFTQPSGRVVEAGRWEIGLLLNYADDPLVLNNNDDERIASVVSAQLTANLVAVVGIADFLDIGVDVPVVLYQDGDESTLLPEASATDASFGLGDIRVVPRVMLVGPRDLPDPAGLALGLLIDTRLPTGDADTYQGEGFRIEPKLALDVSTSRAFRFGLAVGYMVRTDDADLGDIETDDALTWSAAAGITVADGVEIVPEVFGEWLLLADDAGDEELPVEALLGIKWWPSRSVLVQGGGGLGLVRGVGAPDFRLFLGAALSPEPPRDRDGDGYPDDEDGCPDDPEDFDGFEDEDGCPDPDNDQDSILDVDDACPNDPEDFDGFEDVDGCPDLDNDQDSILDVDDACPNDPEDFDGFEDADGCPDPDNDQDSILDVDDLCPNDPESFNGVEDEDGCPDEVVVTCVAIEISDRVYFETDSDVLQARSFGLLNEVARVLNEADWIRLVRVEGHTDSRASDAYNMDLSQRRAESVVRYLTNRGVEPSRMLPEGFGERQPIADNATDEGRALNRRVEFVIVEQEGCPIQPTRE